MPRQAPVLAPRRIALSAAAFLGFVCLAPPPARAAPDPAPFADNTDSVAAALAVKLDGVIAPRIDPELSLTVRIDFADGGRARGIVGRPEAGGRIRRCGRNADCAGDLAVDRLADGRLRIVNDAAALCQPGAPPGFSLDAVCKAVADPARPGRFVPPDAQNRVFLLDRHPLAACIDAADAPAREGIR